jgi:hypothetical protein
LDRNRGLTPAQAGGNLFDQYGHFSLFSPSVLTHMSPL